MSPCAVMIAPSGGAVRERERAARGRHPLHLGRPLARERARASDATTHDEGAAATIAVSAPHGPLPLPSQIVTGTS